VQHTGSVSVVKRSDEKTVAAIFVFQSWKKTSPQWG
jgi:hypothetical protein